MQKYLNYYQPQMIKYNISFNEGAVLDYIMKANTWARGMEKGGRIYFQVNAGKILADLPIIGIKTNSGILRIIAGLVKKGFLERYSLSQPFFAGTEILKDYVYAGGGVAIDLSPDGNTAITVSQYNSSVSNSNVKYIYIPSVQLKEKRSVAIMDLKNMLSSLEGENLTDLGEVNYIDIIELWNGLASSNAFKKVKISKPETGQMRIIRDEIKKLAKEYTKEEFNNGFNNYLKDIKGRTKDPNPNSYSNHRFPLIAFLKQTNGIRKFIYL